MALPKNISDLEMNKFAEDSSGNVCLRTIISTLDIQIGAVEIKNYDSDVRQGVNTSHEALVKNPPLEVLFGEVQGSPTANTLLDRLKTIASAQLPDDHSVTVSNVSLAVTGTFYQTTQPVSGTFWQTTQPVSGAFWQTTQPVSIASIPIASTAATSAKQLADGHNVAVDKIGIGTVVPITVNVTASGATDVIAAAASGHHLRIKAFSISSDDTADSEVEIRDGTTAKFKFNIPKDGGNVVINLVGANWDLTTATALTANTAGVTDLHINVSYEDITD